VDFDEDGDEVDGGLVVDFDVLLPLLLGVPLAALGGSAVENCIALPNIGGISPSMPDAMLYSPTLYTDRPPIQ
jgi:hypothetical protein